MICAIYAPIQEERLRQLLRKLLPRRIRVWSEIRGDEKHSRFEGEAAIGKFFSGLVGGKSLGVPKRFRTLWDTGNSQDSEGSLTTASSRLGLEPRALA